MVSICTITYNHEKYIAQALSSFLHQKTNFDFEIVIGDDCSTDCTVNIIKEFQIKYPGKIILISRDKNIGAIPNLVDSLSKCKGKYIAFCEGDDYWIDTLKLQIQIDFLQSNPDYSLCFHDALVFWEDRSHAPYYFCRNLKKSTYYAEDIINNWFIPSASIVFAKESLYPLPDWFQEICNGDYAMQLLLTLKGKAFFHNQLMSVYRKTSTNLSSNYITSNAIEKRILLLSKINEHSLFLDNSTITKKIIHLKRSLRILKLKEFSKKFKILGLIYKFSSCIFRNVIKLK
ncbi:MAG: glycosyltransferase [Bacteroidales bacterium]|nr:glycosyltransferase [Bacteroidales bacterium]